MRRALRDDLSTKQGVYTRDRETPRIRVYIWSCVFTHTTKLRETQTHTHTGYHCWKNNQILEGVFSKRDPRTGLLLSSASMWLRSVCVFCKHMIEVCDFAWSADSQTNTAGWEKGSTVNINEVEVLCLCMGACVRSHFCMKGFPWWYHFSNDIWFTFFPIHDSFITLRV